MQLVFCGGAGGGATEAMSTVSRDDNAAMSSEDSSSPDDAELELGLGLSLGGGFKSKQIAVKSHYARILTAQDLPSCVSASSSSSSTSSFSSTLSRANATAGTKRSADSVSTTNGASRYKYGHFAFNSRSLFLTASLVFSYFCGFLFHIVGLFIPELIIIASIDPLFCLNYFGNKQMHSLMCLLSLVLLA